MEIINFLVVLKLVCFQLIFEKLLFFLNFSSLFQTKTHFLIDVPRKETNGECQWYPVRRFREEKNIKPYRMAGFTGGGPSRKTSFGSFSGSFSKQKKVEKSAGQQSVLLKNDMVIFFSFLSSFLSTF